MDRTRRHVALPVLCAALLALFVPSPARARIGETVEQCTVRYGEPIKQTSDGASVFFKSGYAIIVSFFGGKADQIIFYKANPAGVALGLALSENEISTLLLANGGQREWKAVPAFTLDKWWQTPDGQLQANYTRQKSLLVVTQAAIEREKERAKQEEANRLKGF